MKLKLPDPSFDSPLIELIIELDHLRKKELSGTSHTEVFFQLKEIFHMLESIGSARIEGNNTTVAAFVENKIDEDAVVDEGIREIRNIEEAMDFVEKSMEDREISKSFLKELHHHIVRNLSIPPYGEGDKTPGALRTHAVQINGAAHTPPQTLAEVETYLDELVSFINEEHQPRYHLLKVAIAHHRFMWIHPFGNGNGRTGRLLTYAMLVKLGFKVGQARILNPTAIFCIDRDLYNEKLAEADMGTDEGIESWCLYVLAGLKVEIDKIDRLTESSYLNQKILLPALKHSRQSESINDEELSILTLAVNKQSIQNSDIQKLFPDKHSQAISRMIKNLKKKKMLRSEKDNQRRYHICFTNNYLMRGIIPQLAKEGFIPTKDE
ncbi:MAG: Fic family protein [Lentisphaeria bacterium]|nr:Fic family protein [Lentisphaeria bacterium]